MGLFISTGIQNIYTTSKAGSEELHFEIKCHNLNTLTKIITVMKITLLCTIENILKPFLI